jgi:hypothetical protein
MSEFSLQDLIREVCGDSSAPDPATLAKEVEQRIEEDQRADALSQALPILVQHAISRSRSGFTIPPGGPCTGDAHGITAAGGPSRKVAAIREAWQRVLLDRISTGPNDWKHLGDCTAADLAYAEALRRAHAEANIAAADRLAELQALLRQHGVATVRELPTGSFA